MGQPNRPRDNSDHGTVLVVDDERGPRLALQLILQAAFRVLTADSGEAALEILKSETVDTVTLDLRMPGLGGQNTLSLIRDADPNLPVIIVTGYGSYESAVKAVRYRAFDYISKPFDSRRTVEVVSNAVEQHRRRKSGESVLLVPLDTALEELDHLESSMDRRLSPADRVGLQSVRDNVRSVREQIAGKSSEDATFDLFAPRKGHG